MSCKTMMVFRPRINFVQNMGSLGVREKMEKETLKAYPKDQIFNLTIIVCVHKRIFPKYKGK